MTSNNALKRAAREHAAKTGVSYTQARREVMAQHRATNRSGPAGIPVETVPVRWVQIQQDADGDGPRPLPYDIDPHGFVKNQGRWRGNPWRLVGFVVSPADYTIDLEREEFLADPDKAIGMHPVFMGRDRAYATFRGPVAETTDYSDPVAAPWSVLADFRIATPEGEWVESIGVGHVLHTLRRGEVAEMASGSTSEAAEDLLSTLCMTGNTQALDLSAHLDDVEEEDSSIQVSLDLPQAGAWIDAGFGQ